LRNHHIGILHPCEAVIYYVSKEGIDSNPGTQEKPFFTLQKAAEVAKAGDTCTVREGIYRETIRPLHSRRVQLSRTHKPPDTNVLQPTPTTPIASHSPICYLFYIDYKLKTITFTVVRRALDKYIGYEVQLMITCTLISPVPKIQY
jgi:hypothetical protein